jgi:hypothetical protein
MSPMSWDEAIEWVHRVFGGRGSVDLPNLSSRELVEAFIPLDRPGLRLVAAGDRTIPHFLWAGVVKHDRWYAPGPFVVPGDYEEWFDRFLNRFRECDPRNTENLPIFNLHRIRNRVYSRRAWSLQHPRTDGYLLDLRERALRLRQPSNPENARSFIDERDTLARLIDGLLAGEIVTRIETSLPVLLDYRRLRGTAEWRGLEFEFHLDPVPGPTEGWEASANAVVEPTGDSRWGAGKTRIVIQIRGLIQ